jgi:hypothetical protein
MKASSSSRTRGQLLVTAKRASWPSFGSASTRQPAARQASNRTRYVPAGNPLAWLKTIVRAAGSDGWRGI